MPTTSANAADPSATNVGSEAKNRTAGELGIMLRSETVGNARRGGRERGGFRDYDPKGQIIQEKRRSATPRVVAKRSVGAASRV